MVGPVLRKTPRRLSLSGCLAIGHSIDLITRFPILEREYARTMLGRGLQGVMLIARMLPNGEPAAIDGGGSKSRARS